MRTVYVSKLIRLLVVVLLTAGVVACSGPDTGDDDSATSATGAGGSASVEPGAPTAHAGRYDGRFRRDGRNADVTRCPDCISGE